MPIRRPGGLAAVACTQSIISAFFEVYNVLRFGLLESAYRAALALELQQRGHEVAREVSVRVFYKGHPIAWQRVDLLVDNTVIVEVKSTAKLPSIAVRQLYSYLHATRIEVGLLLHFGPEAKFYRLFSPNEDGEPTSRADVEGNADKGSVVLSDRSD